MTSSMDSERVGRVDDPSTLRVSTGDVGCLDSGQGSPAVVLVGGAGGFALLWEPVRSRVARVTRALAFDRPGYGTSSPRTGRTPVTSPSRLADELAEVLDAAGVGEPVVLVAHSFGGFIARAFAASHPGRLAGMVLVEATHEDEWTDRYPESHRRGLRLATRSLGGLAAAATVGLPQLLGRLPFVPLGAVDQLPEPYRKRARRVGSRRASLRTAAGEFAGMEAAAREMATTGDLGDLPLVVIAHGRPGPVAPRVSLAEAEQLEALAQRSQQDLARLSTRGRLVRAESGHDVHVEDPELVASEILRLVGELRQQ